MSVSPTPGVSASFTPVPVDDADMAYLLRLLFSEPAPDADLPASPSCGFDAACERTERHLMWFQADAERGVA